MTTLPVLDGAAPGLYQVCTAANTDYVIPVPTGANGVLLWFETSAASTAAIGGRVGFSETNTAVAGLTNADTVLGYHPSSAREYTVFSDLRGGFEGRTYVTPAERSAFLHVAAAVAGAVVRGQWLFD